MHAQYKSFKGQPLPKAFRNSLVVCKRERYGTYVSKSDPVKKNNPYDTYYYQKITVFV